MAETTTTVKKRIELSRLCAERLKKLSLNHRLSEDKIIEESLNILYNLFENVDPQAKQRGWLILPERLLSYMWRVEEGAMLVPPTQMSYEQFLEWADEDTLTEWVDGEVLIATHASDKDQIIREFLHNVLRIYVGINKQGILRGARFQMKLERSGREPDLIFVATENLDRLKPTYLDGPADMVVEISSSESFVRDRGEKFYEYQNAGIPEYWLIDPQRQWAEFYVLGEHGHYQPLMYGTNGVFHSHRIRGFWMRIEWLWQPPPILQALRDLEIISTEE
jgi:Uma2 family endonuclease